MSSGMSPGGPEGPAKVITEDVVCLACNGSLLGLVSETPDEEDEEGPEYEEPDPLMEGQVRVCWLDGEERVEELAIVRVVDRALMHGDIITLSNDPLGQTGHVVGVQLWVDLEGPDKACIKGVPSPRLQHIRPMRAGLYVVCRSWLGRVLDVSDSVTVQFDDGSMCKVNQANPDRLYPANFAKEDIFADEDQSPYYPGQQVRCDTAQVFRHAKWLQGSFRNKLEGVVVHVEPVEVEVEWLVSCKVGDQAGQAPDEIANPRDLTIFSYFSYTCWQLGDRALLPPGTTLADLTANIGEGAGRPPDSPAAAAMEDDRSDAEDSAQQTPPVQPPAGQAVAGGASGSASTVKKPEADQRGCEHSGGGSSVGRIATSGSAVRGRRRRSNGGNSSGGGSSGGSAATRKKEGRKAISIPDVFQVVGTRTTVSVQWQDGSVSKDVPAKDLAPVVQFGDHDLWPELFVEEVGDEDEDPEGAAAAEPPRRTGFVRKMDPESRMATVTWLKRLDSGRLELASDSCVTEQVSVYELREHPHHMYRLGDVVLRLAETGSTAPAPILATAQAPGPAAAKESEPSERCGDGTAVEDTLTEAGAGEGGTGMSESQACEGEADETLSWVGEVIGISNGRPRICWATGQITDVSPESVFVVSRDEDPMDGGGSNTEDEYYGSDSSWETMYGDGEGPEGDGFTFDNLNEHDQISLRWQMEEAMEAEAQLWRNMNDGEVPVEVPGGESGSDYAAEPEDSSDSEYEGGADQGSLAPEDRTAADAQRAEEEEEEERKDEVVGALAVAEGGAAADVALAGQQQTMESLPEDLREKAMAGVKLLADIQKAWNGPSGLGSLIDSVLHGQQTGAAASSSGGGDGATQPPDAQASAGPGRTLGGSGDRVGSAGPEALRSTGTAVSRQASSAAAADHSAPEEGSRRGEQAAAAPSSTAAALTVSEEVFPRYGEVEAFDNHAYVAQPLQPINPSKWHKRVLKDMKTLARNLPDTIWVASSSTQMGLLRAAILGAKGTPYHDNLFFFDIWLPPMYPNTPPEVLYHSGGRRLNPNLYENGKVCLSLLNTWNGREDEMWRPDSSTLLQVLVSIQGLVLVPKPYYNEAGYEKHMGTAEGERNAALYNENAFLLSCRTMMDTVRRPPQHFEALVRSHFKLVHIPPPSNLPPCGFNCLHSSSK
mmetsp:Transcript_17619/g.49241  ORF Transcript_17619/g.49241 Transcript_17619/m.49241 type:complete len:1167 (-) Transcript_17619:484-3984(-)